MVKPMFIPKGYKQTDVGVIPNDWNVNELQNLVNITTGAKNTQDKIDDDFLGLKSSAIFLGKKSKPAISIFYSIFFISISFLLSSLDPINKWLSYSLLAIIGAHLIRQIYLLDIDNPDICHSIFKSNNSIGLLVFFLFFLSF